MKKLIYILFFIIPFLSNGQYDWDSKNWDKESLGFGCSVGGTSTEPVVEFWDYFVKKDFKKIKKKLKSKLSADRFLAVFLLDKLSKKNELELNEIEIELIKGIKKSEELVPVCSGCTYWNEVPLNELLNKKHHIYESADNWFKHYYKIYYKKK